MKAIYTPPSRLWIVLPAIGTLVCIVIGLSFSWPTLNSLQKIVVPLSFILSAVCAATGAYVCCMRMHWCYGSRISPVQPEHAMLSHAILKRTRWCRVPQVTDLGGMAIAITSAGRLAWRLKIVKDNLELYLKDWQRETILDIGTPRVTQMFFELAQMALIAMRGEKDKSFDEIINQHPELKHLHDDIERIINVFERRVGQPLSSARKLANATAIQNSVADQVRELHTWASDVTERLDSWEYNTREEWNRLSQSLLQGAIMPEKAVPTNV